MQAMNPSKHVVLFDLDGTLLDTAPDLYVAINQLLAQEQRSHTNYESLKTVISCGSKKIVQTAFKLSDSSEHIAPLQQRFLTLYRATNFKHTVFFTGTEELLHNLEQLGITWGIVTNKTHWLTEPLLELFKLNQRAACVVSGDTTAYAKPHPEPLLYACRHLNISPQQCLYIGDAEQDMIAGTKAGMTTMAALFGYLPQCKTTDNWPADYYVEKTQDILPAIYKWLKL